MANLLKRWWPGTELNRRRQPFQGCALPPELPGHVRVHSSAARSLRVMWDTRELGRNTSECRQSKRWKRMKQTDYSNQAGFAQRQRLEAVAGRCSGNGFKQTLSASR
jgi:hypothetical protein